VRLGDCPPFRWQCLSASFACVCSGLCVCGVSWLCVWCVVWCVWGVRASWGSSAACLACGLLLQLVMQEPLQRAPSLPFPTQRWLCLRGSHRMGVLLSYVSSFQVRCGRLCFKGRMMRGKGGGGRRRKVACRPAS
jgi:hypothetical protein